MGKNAMCFCIMEYYFMLSRNYGSNVTCFAANTFSRYYADKELDSCLTCSFSLFPDWSTFRFGNKNQFFVVNE